MRAIYILLLFTQSIAYAVSNPPVLLRACVNKTDSTITISWTKISDACGSFTNLYVYGNTGGGAFRKIGNVTDVNQTELPHKVGDPNAVREYYVTIYFLCNGSDSAISDTIAIDDQIPSSTELDSLSYEYSTQYIIAGWSSNKTPDTDRYRLTRPKGSTDEEIAYTQDTFYTITQDPEEVFFVKLATVDSCDFHSNISTAHRVCHLNTSIDTCKREMYLNWSPYQGWPTIDSQVVFIQRNHGALENHTTLTGTANAYTFTDFVLGDTLCFFIRTYNPQGFTSTSNIRCIETRAFVTPDFLYLDNVTVVSDQDIELTWTSGGKPYRRYAF